MAIVRVSALESALSAALPTEHSLGNRLGTTWYSEVREGIDVSGYMRMIVRLC